MENDPLVLFGSGGHGKVIVDAALCAQMHVAFIIDDKPSVDNLLGVRVVSTSTIKWCSLLNFRFLVMVGANQVRERVFQQLKQRGGLPKNIIHPRATVAYSATLKKGTAICAGAIINPDAVIGDNCIINTSATVDHDCVIGDHVHLCPGVHLAGTVTVGNGTMIGTGAVVLPGIHIGAGCMIGAGAVVNRDLPEGVIAFGVPAKLQRYRNSEVK